MTITKKDVINMKSSSIGLQDLKEPIEIDALHIEKDQEVEFRGQVQLTDVGYLHGVDGQWYTTLSPTVTAIFHDLEDLIEDEGKALVQVKKRKTKDGSADYLALVVL